MMNTSFQKLFFYKTLRVTAEVKYYTLSNYIINNTENWSQYRIFSLSHSTFEGYNYGNTFTLRRINIFSNRIRNSILNGTISDINSFPLTINIIIRPHWFLHLMLIFIIFYDLYTLFISIILKIVLNFPQSDFVFKDLNSTLLISLNLLLISCYVWFHFEFQVTVAKFKRFIPEKFKLKEII